MMEIIKNKEEVKSVMNIIQAFADGKIIQAIDPYEDEWVDQAGLNFKALFEGQYRIKPEPTYRPFANAEECWTEMLKHQPFGWVKIEDLYRNIANVTICSITFADNEARDVEYEQAFKNYTFADCTPFGVKLEEQL